MRAWEPMPLGLEDVVFVPIVVVAAVVVAVVVVSVAVVSFVRNFCLLASLYHELSAWTVQVDSLMVAVAVAEDLQYFSLLTIY